MNNKIKYCFIIFFIIIGIGLFIYAGKGNKFPKNMAVFAGLFSFISALLTIGQLEDYKK